MLGKTNWYDSTIVGILQNEIYKGDFVHGKRTKHPFEDLHDTYEFSKNHDYEREKDDFEMQI